MKKQPPTLKQIEENFYRILAEVEDKDYTKEQKVDEWITPLDMVNRRRMGPEMGGGSGGGGYAGGPNPFGGSRAGSVPASGGSGSAGGAKPRYKLNTQTGKPELVEPPTPASSTAPSTPVGTNKPGGPAVWRKGEKEPGTPVGTNKPGGPAVWRVGPQEIPTDRPGIDMFGNPRGTLPKGYVSPRDQALKSWDSSTKSKVPSRPLRPDEIDAYSNMPSAKSISQPPQTPQEKLIAQAQQRARDTGETTIAVTEPGIAKWLDRIFGRWAKPVEPVPQKDVYGRIEPTLPKNWKEKDQYGRTEPDLDTDESIQTSESANELTRILQLAGRKNK